MSSSAISSSNVSSNKDKDELQMNEHMKAMWAGQSNVLVAVRVRPLMKHDLVKKGCVRVMDSNVVIILDPAAGDKYDILRANRSREKQYAFDHVFEPNSTQEHTYLHTAKFLIHGVLDGFNATVFAYGQTGSGKTHTMIGSESEPGIMVRVMDDLFRASDSQGKAQGVQFKVTVSFLEVYNENIRDLLSDAEEYLDLREDPIKGPVVASITEIEAVSGQAIMSLLHQGNGKRSQAATAANEVSSRSHAVLQVVVESRDKAPGTVANIKVGKLSLVDLAGSERAANTKNVGVRLVEGANINRSLLALGNCINALGEKGNKGNFVPYRDSKLTRLLKDSLGGNCRTVMIACISSAESSFEETLNTLKYANRAKNIKTNVQRNVLNVNYHISEYVQLINNLRGEIQVLKSQIAIAPSGQSDVRANSSHHSRTVDGKAPTKADSPPHPKSPLGRATPSTPFHALRDSMRSATSVGGEGRELLNSMRERIVENFQERMQLRRSLIELEDQNVQNSIEVSKRQLLVVQWAETHGTVYKQGRDPSSAEGLTKADFAADIINNGTPEIVEAWQECEQLRKAIMKNNGMKKNIAKRLRLNEKEAENFRDELGDKITGEDRRELMELQYQVGRLELENMELEQHRIVHESILKGKDLEIQKLKLQLAVRDKLIHRQQNILLENNLDGKVGYHQLALMEQTLMGDSDFAKAMVPPSPPRNMSEMAFAGPSAVANAKSHYHHPMMMMQNANGIAMSDAAVDVPVGVAARKKSIFANKDSSSSKRTTEPLTSEPIPRLKISVPDVNAKMSSQDTDDDEIQDEYSIPLSEREVALTARDRDLIEQGDWSEIRGELSDNDHSLVGVRAGVMIASFQPKAISASANASNLLSAAHGLRGGRQIRSLAGGSDDGPGRVQPSQHGFKVHPGGLFQVEDSDEDSVNGNNNNNNNNNNNQGSSSSSKQTSAANRNGVRGSKHEKLDPIPLLPLNSNGEELSGVLSGKRYDSRSSFPLKKDSKAAAAAAAPKDIELGVNNNAYSGFSAIYPTIASSAAAAAAASEERGKKDLQSRVSNPSGANAAGRIIQRRNNSQDQLDLIGSDEGGHISSNEGNSNFSEAAFNDNALQQLQLNIRPKLVVQQQQQQQQGSQQAKQNAALIRLKSHVLPSSNISNVATNANSNINSSNAAAENAEAATNSLNVCGNGFGDRQGVNGEVAAMIRPIINKNRNNSRKVLSKQQQQSAALAQDLGGLSIDGVGSSAPDDPPFNARLRAFSKGDLPKQSQDQQLSARDNRP